MPSGSHVQVVKDGAMVYEGTADAVLTRGPNDPETGVWGQAKGSKLAKAKRAKAK